MHKDSMPALVKELSSQLAAASQTLSRARRAIKAFESGQADKKGLFLAGLIDAQRACDQQAGSMLKNKGFREGAGAASAAIRDLIDRHLSNGYILSEDPPDLEEGSPSVAGDVDAEMVDWPARVDAVAQSDPSVNALTATNLMLQELNHTGRRRGLSVSEQEAVNSLTELGASLGTWLINNRHNGERT